jgi:hypothetical protein
MSYTKLTADQVAQKYGVRATEADAAKTYLLHTGDLALDALSLDRPFLEGADGLIVDGSLTVAGNIINKNRADGPLLHVTGGLRATNIVLGGAHVTIAGNLAVDKFLWTRDSHGSLTVSGNLVAGFVLREKHATWVEGECDATCYKSTKINRFRVVEPVRYRLDSTFNDGNHQTLNTVHFRTDLNLLVTGTGYDDEHDEECDTHTLDETAVLAALDANENLFNEHLDKRPSHINTIAELISAQKCEKEDKINWKKIREQCTMSFLQQHADKLDWADIAECQRLTEAFIEHNIASFDETAWYWLCVEQQLTIAFIERHLDKIHWEEISTNQLLDEAFIEKHQDKLDWRWLSIEQPMTPAFVERHKERLNWGAITKHRHRDNLEAFFYEKFADRLDWATLVKERRYTDDFLEKYAAHLDWELVQKHQRKVSEALLIKHGVFDWKSASQKRPLTDEEIEAHKDEIDWSAVSGSRHFTQEFLEKYQDHLDWAVVCDCQLDALTEDFIRKHLDKIAWPQLDTRNLSEAFINEFADKGINFNQVIARERSEAFLERHLDKLDWKRLSNRSWLTETFIEKHKEKFDWEDLCSNREGLSIEFLDRNSNLLNWAEVSYAQSLTEAFIEKYADKVKWNSIFFYAKKHNLSPAFIKKHEHRQ